MIILPQTLNCLPAQYLHAIYTYPRSLLAKACFVYLKWGDALRIFQKEEACLAIDERSSFFFFRSGSQHQRGYERFDGLARVLVGQVAFAVELLPVFFDVDFRFEQHAGICVEQRLSEVELG